MRQVAHNRNLLQSQIVRRCRVLPTLPLAVLCSVLLAGLGFAQSAPGGATPTPAARKLPKSGLLSVLSVSGASSSVTGETFGGDTLFDPTLPPITGSVSRKDSRTWSFSVTNNSPDRYSVNVDLVQRDGAGRTVKNTSYSHLLKPGQTEQQAAQAERTCSRVELYLRSYRNLSEEKRAREEQR